MVVSQIYLTFIILFFYIHKIINNKKENYKKKHKIYKMEITKKYIKWKKIENNHIYIMLKNCEKKE